MSLSFSLIQLLFSILSILFSIAFTTSTFEGGFNALNVVAGLLGGGIIAALLYGLDVIFRSYNLRSLNNAAIGLFCGYLMGTAFLWVLGAVTTQPSSIEWAMPVKFMVYLLSTYLGLTMVSRASTEINLVVPFIEFKQMSQKKKDILVDLSVLNDSRLLDLASTGLLDHHLIVPRFSLKELYAHSESLDEGIKIRAKRSLELLKKLELISHLDLRFVETDFPEIKDPMMKLVQLARFLDTHIMTSDINRMQQASIEGVRIINIHMLSNALKPITQTGEALSIKIQRYGKEARQGIGYLEDGTMVVVNGGAEFIGETIKASVLSVKHTSSGRMIFCNVADDEGFLHDPSFNTRSEEQAPALTF